MQPPAALRMACLEIRGGNERATYSIDLPGMAAWVSCRPLTPATRGGDLHYLSVCSQGSVSRITVADVAGHGELVSSVAERLRDVLRKHSDAWDQSDVVRDLNDSFLAGAEGLQYATAIVLGYYSATGELLFTNAGHLPPLWYHAADEKWTLMHESTPYSKEIADLPLGMISGTPYTQTAVQIEPGDLIVLYTDGVTDSTDYSGAHLDQHGLLGLARRIPLASASEAGRRLIESLDAFRGAVPPNDDETVVVLERVIAN
jgi:sigma-B regulation protein RsbU (phosphoserine phosphatase)